VDAVIVFIDQKGETIPHRPDGGIHSGSGLLFSTEMLEWLRKSGEPSDQIPSIRRPT
jgi:hypothetical protein